MVSLLSRGVGGLLRSLAGINCSQVIRCTSVSSGILGLQCTPCRWFAKRSAPSDYLKRPLTAYLRFFIEQRPKLCKQYPETKLMDLTKIIALEWKGLPSADKEPYETVAKAEQKKYREEVKQYREALSPMQLELQREQRRQRLAKRKSVRKKRELTVLGRPKRPRSSFNIFMSEHFQDAKGTSSQTKMKSLRDEWERLHNAQKQPYNHLAEDDKIRYENEMKSWEEQMMEIGRLDLVRLNQRKRFKKPRAARASSKSNTAKKALTESSSHNEGFRGPKQHEE
ncbi:transcription factor A, mitochondrial [Xenopus laevis]|uniref:Transcription factor A, mitochondrial n=1 Tax=Xenopus laevis TaxID=8355 RepID=A0A8J1LB90_XENLA|nr:transcription factor A, mitochondrial [Xenopus laevis]